MYVCLYLNLSNKEKNNLAESETLSKVFWLSLVQYQYEENCEGKMMYFFPIYLSLKVRSTFSTCYLGSQCRVLIGSVTKVT